MSKVYNGTAVPRHFLFVNASGASIVQLSTTRGQDLFTGQFVELNGTAPGSPLSDAELDRLKIAGRIESYNRAYAWVTGLPGLHVYDPAVGKSESGRKSVRMYYVNTNLPPSDVHNVQDALRHVGADLTYATEIRANQIAITSVEGILFNSFELATEVQEWLAAAVPELFGQTVVAFTNVELRDSQLVHEFKPDDDAALAALIASQSDTTVTAEKKLMLLVNTLDDRMLIYNLCLELKMSVQVASSAADALALLDDESVDILIMDMQLQDMHGWELLSKLREVDQFRNLPIIVVADRAAATDESLALIVAKVDVYLERPLSKARVRQNIWMALQKH